jgi:hypothetical protein
MGIVRRPPIEKMYHLIGAIVAIGVAQPQEPRFIHHEHAAIPKLKARRADEPVVKPRALIRAPVAISILKNQ